MIIHKKDGIYIKDVKYHINIEDKEYHKDPWYVGKNGCFYIATQNPEWIIKKFYRSAKIIINAINITSYNCIVIY